MPVYWKATDFTAVQVQALCENCGKEIVYLHPVGVTATSNSRSKASSRVSEYLDDEIVLLNRIIKREGFDERAWWKDRQGAGDEACSHCGYVQSWQVPVRQGKLINKLTDIIGIVIGILIFAIVVINSPVKDSIPFNIFIGLCVAMPVAAFSAVGISFLLPPIVLKFYRINREFPKVTTKNKPQIAEIKPVTRRY